MSPARGLQWHGRQRRPEHGVAVAAEVRAELADDAAASRQLEQERVAAELRRALRRLVLPVEVFSIISPAPSGTQLGLPKTRKARKTARLGCV